MKSNLKLAENTGYTTGTNDARKVLLKQANLELDSGNPKTALALAKCSQKIGLLSGEE